ncbi:Epsin-1 [Frankliniella fusca]|uniref:Epsin-1 n=1 Tax=Frankliniella fusca TaxID=407009 RepID=A0AAE1HGH4_9NEOP|nr:Epsin-1 [Frankliniella fusca]
MAAKSPHLLATCLPLLLLLLGPWSCNGAKLKETTANINDLTDEVLRGITNYIVDNNMTVVKLPDVQQSFSVTLLWILSLSGTVNLTLGTVTDFAHVERDGDMQVTFLEDARQVVAYMRVKISRLHAHYTFSTKTGVVKQQGELDVTVTGTKVYLMLNMFMNTLKPAVVDMKVEDLGKIDVGIKDGVLGWVASGVANIVVGSMRRTIRDAVEKQVPALINEFLDKIDIPAMIRPPAGLQGDLAAWRTAS